MLPSLSCVATKKAFLFFFPSTTCLSYGGSGGSGPLARLLWVDCSLPAPREPLGSGPVLLHTVVL